MTACAFCGSPYVPKAEGQIVCSFGCSRALYRQQNPETHVQRRQAASLAADNGELPKSERRAVVAQALAEQRAAVARLRAS